MRIPYEKPIFKRTRFHKLHYRGGGEGFLPQGLTLITTPHDRTSHFSHKPQKSDSGRLSKGLSMCFHMVCSYKLVLYSQLKLTRDCTQTFISFYQHNVLFTQPTAFCYSSLVCSFRQIDIDKIIFKNICVESLRHDNPESDSQ